MLIELKWLPGKGNPNCRTEIWRADKEFSVTDEAVLIATVDVGVTNYADADVVQGNVYFYRLRTVLGDLKNPLSKQFAFEANQYTGPGPQRTVFGDEHFGYYGKFPSDPTIVPNLNQVRKALGLVEVDEVDDPAVLHKFAIGGRIRGILTVPVSSGMEIARINPLLAPLLDGGYIPITLGLHTWAIILPSVGRSQNPNPAIEHFPGELRSMLGVVTDMYSRIEDATTGNSTGNRLLPGTGQVSFFDAIEERFGQDIKWIASSDQLENNVSTVIDWTDRDPVAPLRPKELHIVDVDYTDDTNWYSTVIWPVIIYTGLVGPT